LGAAWVSGANLGPAPAARDGLEPSPQHRQWVQALLRRWTGSRAHQERSAPASVRQQPEILCCRLTIRMCGGRLTALPSAGGQRARWRQTTGVGAALAVAIGLVFRPLSGSVAGIGAIAGAVIAFRATSRLAVGLVVGAVVGVAFWVGDGFLSGLATGLTAGLTVGLTVELVRDSVAIEPVERLQFRRSRVALAVALIAGLIGGMAYGLGGAVGAGVTAGLAAGLTGGMANNCATPNEGIHRSARHAIAAGLNLASLDSVSVRAKRRAA
jgi:hypothetical protein